MKPEPAATSSCLLVVVTAPKPPGQTRFKFKFPSYQWSQQHGHDSPGQPASLVRGDIAMPGWRVSSSLSDFEALLTNLSWENQPKASNWLSGQIAVLVRGPWHFATRIARLGHLLATPENLHTAVWLKNSRWGRTKGLIKIVLSFSFR